MHMTFATDPGVQKFLSDNTSPGHARRLLALSRRPVIIGGCGRSGTTLLLSVLSCHPHIWGIERETMAFCPDGFHGTTYTKNPDLEMPFQSWKVLELLIQANIPESCTRWCEKTPRNVVYFEQILRYFGAEARLIHIVRDGRDVTTSIHPLTTDHFWVPIHRWVMDVSAGRRFEDHPQVLTIRYEDFLGEYEATLRRICAFIDEEFHPNFLQYPQTAKVLDSMAWNETARPISTRSIGRWRKPELAEHIREFHANPQAVELLRHYGYSLD